MSDGVVKFIRVAVQVNVQISELGEDEVFPLPVFEEEEGNEILVAKIHEFLGGET